MLVSASSKPAAVLLYPMDRAVASSTAPPQDPRAPDTRIAAALSLDNPPNQILWQIICSGMTGDQGIKIAVGIEK